mgnify:CR=1 FL=1
MSKEYRVAVAGATGAVGRAMRSILEERGFPVKELVALATATSFWVAFGGFVVMLAAALWFERSVRKMGRAGMEQLGRSLRGGGLRDYLGTTSDRLRERVRRDADDGPPPPPDA